ncbi:MAG: bifunctional UDP-sugar hydrolase/5'-nucleotidase [Verrucomicrobiota bacterium]
MLFAVFGWIECLPAREVPITILHTTDLHGHVLPAYDYDGNENVGGLLRCATLIRKLRAEKKNVHLIDGGDLIQGGAESFASNGRIMIEAMEALEYDAWAVGNHEFDWGLENLQALLKTTRLNTLAANMQVKPGAENPLPIVKPYVMKEIEGVRIAYVGLTTPGIPSWSRPYLLGPLLFTASVDALRVTMPKVRAEKPDIKVLVLHQGYRKYGDDHANEINRIAKHFPEFDLIVGGHTHRVVESLTLGQTLYTQAGYFGNWLGEVDLVYDTVKKELTRKVARIHHIARNYDYDPELYARFKERLEPHLEKQERVIGRSDTDLNSDAEVPGQSLQQELIARAILEGTGADIVIHGALDDRVVPAGEVKEKDIWKIVPYENAIGIVSLTVGEIKEVLEENARRTGSHYYMGTLGLCYEVDANAEVGQRISNL